MPRLTSVRTSPVHRGSQRPWLSAAFAAVLAAGWSSAHGQCEPEWSDDFGPAPAGLNGNVRCLCVFDDGSGPALYVGGAFTAAGGVPVSGIARWDGDAWSDVGGGLTGGGATALAMAVFDADGTGPDRPELVVGGGFTTAGGIAADNIAKWNGSAWSGVGAGCNNTVRALGVLDIDGDEGASEPTLYAGGDFTTAGGVSANFIASWNGTVWDRVGAGTSGGVFALCAFDEDDAGPGSPSLYVGGAFPTAGGLSATFIAAYGVGGWRTVGTGVNSTVNVLQVADLDGPGGEVPALYAGGYFTTAGGSPASRIAKWNGSAWSALGGGTDGRVRAIARFDDGSGAALYAGGDFLYAGAALCGFIARWNGAAWSAVGTGSNSASYALTTFEDGDGAGLYAGGNFELMGGKPAMHLSRWGCAMPPCRADVNGDGLVDFSDYLEFLSLYDAGDPAVDFNGDGLVDFADYLEFLSLYDMGC